MADFSEQEGPPEALPESLRDLDEMTWQGFEELAITVLGRYYAALGITVQQTKLSHDGGRDGEGVFVFGSSPTSELALVVKLWIEVKKRGRNVGLKDLAKTLLRADNERVTKLIFVTNSDYSPEAREEIERFSHRHGLAYSLLSGTAFLDVAQAQLSIPSSGSSGAQRREDSGSPNVTNLPEIDLQFELLFSNDPLRFGKGLRRGNLHLSHSAPIFAFLNVRVLAAQEPLLGRIALQPCDPKALEVFSYEATDQDALALGDELRKTFVVWPKREGLVSSGDLRVTVTADRPIRTEVVGVNSAVVNRQLLGAWVPPSRHQLLLRFEKRLENWAETPSFSSVVISAGAGVGKSYLLSRLRVQWLRRQVREISIDGEVDNTDLAIVDRVFRYLFPVSADVFSRDHRRYIKDWLVEAGMTTEVAERLAKSIASRRSFDPTEFDSRSLGEVLAVLLTRFCGQERGVFVFEDLHKVHPSGLAVLLEMHRSLRRSGKAHLYFISTTREYSSAGDPETRRDWLRQVADFLTASGASSEELGGLSGAEAVELVLRTVPSLRRRDAGSIIEQVGRTPFGIREALAYLVDVEIAGYDEAIEEYVVLQPELLRHAIRSRDFEQATALRLQALRERFGGWLGEVFDAGACLGRDFSLDTVLRVVNTPGGEALRDALGYCERRDVLRASPVHPDLVRFDHDLVRTVTLRTMGSSQQRRLAKALYDLESSDASERQAASLAYQAGLAEECYGHARAAARECRERQCFADALAGLELAKASLDSDAASEAVLGFPAELSWNSDEAVRVARPCLIIGLSPSARDTRLLELILESLECHAAVGSGSGDEVASAVTEGQMIARRARDVASQSRLSYQYGRMLFERDQIEEALQEHQRAEQLAAGLEGDAVAHAGRALNLVRLAICQRQADGAKESLSTLREALRYRADNRWDLLVRVLSNYGAAFLYSDWTEVRRFWQKALAVAERHGLDERVVHTLIDVGYLDLLERRTPEARAHLERAGRSAEAKRYENSLLRVHLNLGCLDLLEGDLANAHRRFGAAEDLAMFHRIGRRLWRVRANLATTYEALDDLKRAYILDRSTVDALAQGNKSRMNLGGQVLWRRELLPLANIALRSRWSPPHRKLLAGLEALQQDAANQLATAVLEGERDGLPNRLGAHLGSVSGAPRFILTE